MTLPTLVLVHGGGHAADCREPTIEEIHCQAPDLKVLAVDLPGRRGKPGDLLTLKIADFVDSVVDDIDEAGLNEIVLVGHSLAGLTVPGVLTKLGSSRVCEMVLATAFVPPEGKTLVDTLTGPFARLARRGAEKGAVGGIPAALARFGFFNGMWRAQREFMSGKLYADSTSILTEICARTWILTVPD